MGTNWRNENVEYGEPGEYWEPDPDSEYKVPPYVCHHRDVEITRSRSWFRRLIGPGPAPDIIDRNGRPTTLTSIGAFPKDGWSSRLKNQQEAGAELNPDYPNGLLLYFGKWCYAPRANGTFCSYTGLISPKDKSTFDFEPRTPEPVDPYDAHLWNLKYELREVAATQPFLIYILFTIATHYRLWRNAIFHALPVPFSSYEDGSYAFRCDQQVPKHPMLQYDDTPIRVTKGLSRKAWYILATTVLCVFLTVAI